MRRMPSPPVPAHAGDFPKSPPEKILYEKDLTPISSYVHPETVLFSLPFPWLFLADPHIERVQTAKLTVKGRWEKLFFTIIKPGEKFNHTIETCHGVSSSKSQTTEFGTDIGAKGDIASIDAKLKKVAQSTYTVTESKKDIYTIEKSVEEETTVCWWQEVLTFETSGTISEYASIIIPGTKKKKRVKLGSRPYVHDLVVEQQTIPETSYPK